MGLLRFIFRRLNTQLAKVVLSIVFTCSVLYSQENNIELVESIPVETTLDNSDIRNTQEVWLEMINAAQKSLDIEQFYISNEKGEPLDTVLNAIVAAAKRGVIVRIIVDGRMYQTYPESADELDKIENIEVRKIDIKSLTGGIQHAKYFIVDDKQIFLGSQNFDWRALKHIHELGVRIKHKDCIPLYKNVFEYDWCLSIGNNDSDKCDFGYPSWQLCTIFNQPIFGLIDLYPIFSSVNSIKNFSVSTNRGFFRLEDHINKFEDLFQINRLIQFAKSEITLQFLSYNPVTKDGYWEEIDTALISASKRGVKVKLIVSDWNLGKTAVEHFKELIQYPNFEVRYTSIPEYSGGFIPYARVEHCKFITADNYTWIGTSNMSYDYFYESRNVGLVVESGKFTQRVRDIFYKSWNSEYAHAIESTGEYMPRKRNLD
jgi:phosphatidylserine/phosphatidylglycerophosphate/cardiolipin synthase-like enzyme